MQNRLARLTLITFIGLSLISTTWLINSGARSQGKERIVVRKPWPLEPVKVTAVKTKNKGEVKIGEEFDEEDDWLDGFTLTVANNYDKTVTAMTIEIVFRREFGDTRSPFAFALHLGPSPNRPEYLKRNPNKVIKVGEKLDLRLSPKNYETLKRGFELAGYAHSIKRIELVIREVGFEDGSMLQSGTLYLQDPAYPNDPTRKYRCLIHPVCKT